MERSCRERQVTQYSSQPGGNAMANKCVGVLAAALLASTALVSAQAAEVTQQRLENAKSEPQNWLTSLGDYAAQRFSSLNQINRDNVKNLKLAFTLPITSGLKGIPATVNAGLENPPLVIDGTMYLNDVW